VHGNLVAFGGKSLEVSESRLRRDRILFYAGLVLLLAGLPGLALGSLFHDTFRVEVVGSAFDAWGWINQLFAYLGVFVGVVGIALLALSLRGGIADSVTEAEGEGEAG